MITKKREPSRVIDKKLKSIHYNPIKTGHVQREFDGMPAGRHETLAVSCCHSSVSQNESRVEFFADTGHWLVSQGVVGINNVCLIQKPLPNEQNLEEQ